MLGQCLHILSPVHRWLCLLLQVFLLRVGGTGSGGALDWTNLLPGFAVFSRSSC